MGSNEVAGSSNTKKNMATWLQFRLFSAPHITECSYCTSIPSLTSQYCGDSLPSVCLAGQVGAINRPPEHPWTPDRPVNEASVKADR